MIKARRHLLIASSF